MKDQAEKLRALAQRVKDEQESGTKRLTRVITITSGKGGVGKTNIAANLAIALSNQGKEVILFDADLGLANVDVILGITPKYNLKHVLSGEKSILDIIAEGPNGIKVIAGGSGVQELANLSDVERKRFVNDLSLLEGKADIILIDTSAGLSKNVLSFILAASEVLLITTPEPTAITDAYGVIKVLAGVNTSAKVKLIVNMAENIREAENVAERIILVARQFLEINIENLGFVLEDSSVAKSVKKQSPFSLMYPSSYAANCINKLAISLSEQAIRPGDQGVKMFFTRMLKLFR